MDYPSISIDKYHHEKLNSEHARWDRVSISVSTESMRYRIRTHTYKHTYIYMHRPMDFLREITFVARETDLLDRAISFNDRFLYLWITLFAGSESLLLQQ